MRDFLYALIPSLFYLAASLIIISNASCAPLTIEQQEARYQAQLLAEQQAHLLQQQKASAVPEGYCHRDSKT